jgi:hypothetical protein
VSYFDHDLPDFVQDGLVITASGLQAAPDDTHQAVDFPGYWNAGIRQYVYYDGHNGYDYNISYEPVYAAAAGKVIFARMEYPDAPQHGYGNMIMIQHRHGYVTLYGHLSKMLVRSRQKVWAGQEIGISGNTGHSTGPHLHFTVFHNCTPTDPYGWSGAGADPLSAYQGETSEYLWERAPLVDNPLPQWPGLASLPAPPVERLVLLRLPTTSGGSAAFLADLHAEADAAAHALRAWGAQVREDLLRGLLVVDGPVAPSAIYRVAGVASISSPDTIEGAKADVLAALARAALVRPHRTVVLNRADHWYGFLLRWQGQTLLVGRGNKGGHVNLRLASGRGGSWHSIQADPKTGAYAIDLGPMSPQQFHQLQSSLQSSQRRGSASVEPVVRNPVPAPHGAGHESGFSDLWLLLPVLLVGGAVGATLLRRRLQPAVDGGDGGSDQAE